MKVISGKYKGKKLLGYDLNGTRPTMDRVKESLFGMIQENIYDSVVLDLFAGSGALGIECISRGAEFVQFVEKDRRAIACISQNLKGIDYSLYNVMNVDYIDALKYFRQTSQKFDVVFIDPPYESGFYAPAVEIIARYNLLADNGIMVLEMEKSTKFDFDKSKWSIYKEREYGITKILVLQKI